MIESKIIDFKTELELRKFVLKVIEDIRKEDVFKVEYFLLHLYPDGASLQRKRIIITFHERVYNRSLSHDVPDAPLSNINPHTTMPTDALHEFRDKWVICESIENSRNQKVRAYLVRDFYNLAQE